ncbi:MAG: energy transducer TonB [Candidatus Sulfotelmatobacter sp.]
MLLTLHNYLWAEFRKSNPARLAAATLTLVLCLMAAFVPASLAQRPSKSERKVIVVATPDYPDILRHAQVGGTVRLRATVLPNGSVTNVEVVGGNPILAENAVTAVKKWKYAPAATQTTEDVSLSFTPH